MRTISFFYTVYKYLGVIFLSGLVSCQAQSEKAQEGHHVSSGEKYAYTNELINESSPYLLQHAHNPVNWFPWGEKALNKAKKEDKLLIISVGYAACHWCHVMEHESFEDTAVAELMNDAFIAVKVDREERPDIDDIYMKACQLTNPRSCGWPLNAIALPDGRPIFVGTYYPKEEWVTVLNKISQLYEKNPDKADEFAGQLTKGIQSLNLVNTPNHEEAVPKSTLTGMVHSIIAQTDLNRGGQKEAPKFPMPSLYQFLMKYAHINDNEKAWEAVEVTLDEMGKGGIYDHLGGGFARYSTDELWKVPHFEKMLYDNAQLVGLYAHAYQKTGNRQYEEIVRETLAFIHRELTAPEGGFYSSLDADSEGEEGKFYVWEKKEIENILGDRAKLFAEVYEITADGNWEEGKNILYRKKSVEELAAANQLTEEAFLKDIEESKNLLFQERSKRIRPGLDDKIITSWNGLMIQAYTIAYRVFGDQTYLDRAMAQARFVLTHQMDQEHRLYRIHKKGKSSINGFLDDYALMTEALIELYQATLDEYWLLEAKELMTYALEHFFDPPTNTFFYTSDEDPPLISRQKELGDNVIPGSNSSMCKVLYLLGTYFYEEEWINISRSMLSAVAENMLQQPSYHSNWASTALYLAYSPYEVAIIGEDYGQLRSSLDQHYLPEAIFLGGDTEGDLPLLENKLVKGQTTIYVCQEKICKLPVTKVEEAIKLIMK